MSNVEKRWEGLTIDGELSAGVFYAGARHKHFTLRVPMAGDMIDVQIEHPEGSIQVATLAMLHKQLLSLGDIPSDALTYDLLHSELSEGDLRVLSEADEALEKKLKLPSAVIEAGDKSSTSSFGMDTD